MFNGLKFPLTALLFLISTNVFALSFDISGNLISGSSTNSPHNIGTIDTFGEAFIGTINIDTNNATTLAREDNRAVYQIDSASFNLQFLETNLSYELTTNGSSSYVLFEVWDNYGLNGNCFGCVFLPPQDRYEIMFVKDQTSIYRYLMSDGRLTSTPDTTIISSLDIPTTTKDFSSFGFHLMTYTAPEPSNWQISGVKLREDVVNITVVPEPSSYALLLSGLALITLAKRKHQL